MRYTCASQLWKKLYSMAASPFRLSKKVWLAAVLPTIVAIGASASAPYPQITVVNDDEGSMMLVDGKPFMINGMNWDYFPIGTNYSYSLWTQPDDVIREALDKDMSMLKDMGVNAIRQHTGVPARWVRYIYEKYGIWTMIYSSFGRYGVLVDGVWNGNTDYENPKVAKVLLKEAADMIKEYNNTPGILMYMLGNENNYGLFWKGAEAENLPVEDRNSTKQARALYHIMNEAAVEMKKLGATAPVAICNGDLLFLDIIAKECTDIDILGVNVYRGPSFGDLFDRVKAEYGKPVFFSEFGSDAYNARTQQEAQKEQADVLVSNWNEIYSNAHGLGKAGNSIGGFTFQFADGWWKHGQDVNLDKHDATASWSNGAYAFDFTPGENNMNEEWFGICAKGMPDERGIYDLYPRAAYYALKDVHKINPYEKGSSVSAINSNLNKVDVTSSMLRARGDKAALESEKTKLFSISELRGDFSTYTTGGRRTTTPDKRPEHPTGFPSFKGFDHMESFYLGVKATPSANAEAEVTVNVLGNVAENPIDEIFYENRGRSRYVLDDNGQFVNLGSLERVKLYSASLYWDANLFSMYTFYRKPHFHWGYEGDFFGFYPEASYGDYMDIYGGEAPFGTEFEGKKFLKGLKLAFGPELWWGANPAVLAKYSRTVRDYTITGVFHWDIAQRTGTVTSYVIPQPKNTRASLAVQKKFGRFDITLGGIWSGVNLVGRTFQATVDDAPDAVAYTNKVKTSDTFGGKGKVVYTGNKFSAYVQGAYMGLVASGGAQYARALTGWSLKDTGMGNQTNVLGGFTFQAHNFQIAPNFLWQKPLVGPMPAGIEAPGRIRNILDDPFAVRDNREQTAGEILLTYDPTPGTWMYDWDNDNKEDAPFAMSMGFVYRHYPTCMDAAIGILADGRTTFVFPTSVPAHDLWDANFKITSRLTNNFGFIVKGYMGTGQANGNDPRLIKRGGLDLDLVYKNIRLKGAVKFNDWGPYDYHRDFNLTFPFQGMLDLSTHIGRPQWLGNPRMTVGIRGTYRTLDKYSPRYIAGYVSDGNGNFVPSVDIPGARNGNEWEIRTYIRFNIF